MEVRSIKTIVKALNDAKVQYLIVGGLAVGAHGYDRLTADVDLVIGLQPQNITLALRTLQAAGWRMSVPVTLDRPVISWMSFHCASVNRATRSGCRL